MKMLSEPWKRKLINFTHLGSGEGIPLQTRAAFPKTVLGRKLRLGKTMAHSFTWLNKIKGEVRRDELMSNHTSIRIGGPADIFILPKNVHDIKTIMKNKGDTPLFMLGEGTNLLVRDRGIRGIAVSLKACFRSIKTPVFFQTAEKKEKALLRVGAGVKLSYLAKFAARYSLKGIERLAGIPGSLGGAVIMNAGAEGTEIGQVIRSVTIVNSEGELETLQKDEIEFLYRKTIFPSKDGVVIEAELELEKGNAEEIQEIISDHLSRRSAKQPLTIPNSGSVFKNPENDTAGRMIESAGLKGFTIGKAGVSLKHANFIVNKGNANAEDVLQLIEHIQKRVKEKTGTMLEPEIVVVGN